MICLKRQVKATATLSKSKSFIKGIAIIQKRCENRQVRLWAYLLHQTEQIRTFH